MTLAATPAGDADPAFLAELQAFVGRGAELPGFDAPEPVTEGAIRQMVHAVGDRNPLYLDADLARRTVHGAQVAPPLWLYSWMMGGLGIEDEDGVLPDGTRLFRAAPGGQRRSRPAAPTLRDEVNRVLEARGFASPVVTEMSYRIGRYLRVGERPRFSSWIVDDVVGPKTTRIGVGFFVTLRLDVFVGDERIASLVQRYLRMRPLAGAGQPAPAAPASAPADADRGPLPAPIAWRAPEAGGVTRAFGSIRTGDALPDLAVDLSPTLIIAGALASRDFQDVHHDFLVSAQRGHPTIFMNMMTLSGLVGRFVTDWTGPDCIVREHTLRLGRPNYAGDRLTLSGTVTEAGERDGRRLVRIAFAGTNRLGRASDGDVLVEFPA